MKGLTLIEVVVWVGVTVLLFTGMILAIINIYKGNDYTMERALAVTSARKGLEELVQIIREAGYSDSGAYPIVAFGANTITLYADADNDNSKERVRFFIEDNQLKRGVIQSSGVPAEYTGAETVTVIVDDIQNISMGQPLFAYKDASGAVITNYANVLTPVFVSITLIANTGRNPFVTNYELRGSAFMRNLKN